MKKIICVIVSMVLLTQSALFCFSAETTDKVNVCLNKTVIGSSRLQYNELYPHNLTDGDKSLRASSYFIDMENPYEWFRINLSGEYLISQITISVSGEILPSNLAVDVWSDGKWVRLVRDYNISASDYPINYFFGEIKASYIQISTNGIPNAPEDVPESVYAFSLSEVEAFYEKDVIANNNIEKLPNGAEDIPKPRDINEFLFEQGLKEDPSVSPYIPNDVLESTVGQYEKFNYTAEDIKYLKSMYKNTKYTGNTISMAGSDILN